MKNLAVSNRLARFERAHRRLADDLDDVEARLWEIGSSPTPETAFLRHQRALHRFLHYLDSQYRRHVREEENWVRSILSESGPLNQGEVAQVLRSLPDQHRHSGELVENQKEEFQRLLSLHPEDPSEYYAFCSTMLDLIWSLRRHVWREDCWIFPTIRRALGIGCREEGADSTVCWECTTG